LHLENTFSITTVSSPISAQFLPSPPFTTHLLHNHATRMLTFRRIPVLSIYLLPLLLLPFVHVTSAQDPNAPAPDPNAPVPAPAPDPNAPAPTPDQTAPAPAPVPNPPPSLPPGPEIEFIPGVNVTNNTAADIQEEIRLGNDTTILGTYYYTPPPFVPPNNGLGGGPVAGIIIACLAAASLARVAIWAVFERRKKSLGDEGQFQGEL